MFKGNCIQGVYIERSLYPKDNNFLIDRRAYSPNGSTSVFLSPNKPHTFESIFQFTYLTHLQTKRELYNRISNVVLYGTYCYDTTFPCVPLTQMFQLPRAASWCQGE